MKDIPLSKLLQDVSAFIGGLLPLAQLFFYQWTYAFDNIFMAKDQFLGISIVTLIVSYILIIAYVTKPYSQLILPGQRKKDAKLQEYWNKRNQLQERANLLATEHPINVPAFNKVFKEMDNLKQPGMPLKINQENVVFICVFIAVVAALSFVMLSFTSSRPSWAQAIQSIAYIIFIAFSALMLTIYKKMSDNSAHWRRNNQTRADKAIKLAIDANGFTDLPQVAFINQYEAGNLGSEFHVRASYKTDIFEIVTDREAEYLISIQRDNLLPAPTNQG